MSKNTALTLIDNPGKYLPSPQEIEDVLRDLGDILSRRIFGVITIAGGGAGVFKVLEPGAEETTNGVQAIEGVILASHLVNVRWGHDFGTRQQGERPLCRSMDGLTGVDQETGETHTCAACPYNQFGADGQRKACANKRQLYIMREGDLLPMLLSLPPSALKAFDSYRVLASLTMRTPMNALVTRITLKNKLSAGGSEYSSPVFTAVGKLPAEDGKRADAFGRQIMDALQRQGVNADEMGADDAAPGQNGGYAPVDDDELPPFN